MKRTTALRLSAAALAVAALATTAGPTLAGPSTPSGRDLSVIRAATARYHDVEVAKADGYVEIPHCEANGEGTMGVHFVHPQRSQDAAIDPARPELLLYLPSQDGMDLIAVEYFMAEAAAGGSAPTLYGVPFDGPMDGHTPDMPRHYDLHVWTWRHNPAGMTAQYNPALSCTA